MPALGSNINAALGRIDYSPIARGGESMARGIAQAGQVKGQTYASIGQNISQGIQKYQKNQLEKKEQEGARNMLEKALEDPRLANALKMSPGDDNVYDKGELNAIITSAGGREKLSAFLNRGQQLVAQQDQQEFTNKLDREKLQASINDAARAFNQGDRGLDITEAQNFETNRLSQERLQASINDAARAFNQGDRKLNITEAQNFEANKLNQRGQRIQKDQFNRQHGLAEDQFELTKNIEQNRRDNAIDNEGLSVGYMWNEDRTAAVPIKGGLAEYNLNQAKAVAKEKAEQALVSEENLFRSADSARNTLNDVLTAIDTSVDELDNGNVKGGIIGAVANYLPTSSTHTQDTRYSQIRSNVVLNKLAEMKALSKTGATGFGQMNEKEFGALENAFGQLAVQNDPKQQKLILEQIKRSMEILMRHLPQRPIKIEEQQK